MTRIAHFGAFDHNSYGDLLFPLIAERELAGLELVHVSPTGQSTPWQDARPTIGLTEALERSDWDGVLVGGGDIIGDGSWWAPLWERRLDPPCTSVLGLWAGASLLALRHNVPLAWNAPGVPASLKPLAGHVARICLEASDYIAVRDAASAQLLRACGATDVKVIADTALALPRLWPIPALTHNRLVVTVSIQELLHRHVGIASLAEQLARHDATATTEILGVSLMGWQQEQTSAGDLGQLMTRAGLRSSHLTSLQAVAETIGASRGYVGNSLHGLITAIAYGRPAVLVVPVDNADSHKYRGFLETVGLDPDAHLVSAWHEVEARLMPQLQHSPRLPPTCLAALDEHWSQLVRCLQGEQRLERRRPWQQVQEGLHSYGQQLLRFGVTPHDMMGCRLALEGQLAALDAQLKQQRWTTAQLQTIAAHLEKERADLCHRVAELEAEIAEIKASRSWQLTEPYRRLRSLLRGEPAATPEILDR